MKQHPSNTNTMSRTTEVQRYRDGYTVIETIPLIRRIKIGGYMMDVHKSVGFDDEYVVSLHGCEVSSSITMWGAIKKAKNICEAHEEKLAHYNVKALERKMAIKRGEKLLHGDGYLRP